MHYCTFIYRWNSRDLRKIIVAILKSWMANEVNKINYVQNSKLSDGGIKKNEDKILFINTEDEEKLIWFLSKNFPQLERVIIS